MFSCISDLYSLDTHSTYPMWYPKLFSDIAKYPPRDKIPFGLNTGIERAVSCLLFFLQGVIVLANICLSLNISAQSSFLGEVFHDSQGGFRWASLSSYIAPCFIRARLSCILIFWVCLSLCQTDGSEGQTIVPSEVPGPKYWQCLCTSSKLHKFECWVWLKQFRNNI